uniref:General transcription and DNA repair factor IIH subunit TFB5 n=2 Tax=Anolis carolinensis TaxID=28377 RepID=A0A803T9V2_ANOCA|nr:PREDICTED: general transcription factor IIH subunit 5 isoform X1 [Anolis carolinensis]|eukprot:XP_003215819.2 PREDICTED: general transcription factor IIH subunit 5 isoform X1 [Anolis carolinensis]
MANRQGACAVSTVLSQRWTSVPATSGFWTAGAPEPFRCQGDAARRGEREQVGSASCLLALEPDTFGKMVNVLKGILIECDPAMKQFLLYLDESNALGKKFIIQDLDETHVFVLAEMINCLQEKVGELMDQNSFPITQK